MTQAFRLTLIHPCVGRWAGDVKYIRSWQMEPLAPAAIAGLTPPGVDVGYDVEPAENASALRTLTHPEGGAERLAAIRYSGRWSRDGHDRHLAQLREVLAADGRSPIGEPIWARYDPPWTPWFLRRNEVLVELDEPPSDDTPH